MSIVNLRRRLTACYDRLRTQHEGHEDRVKDHLYDGLGIDRRADTEKRRARRDIGMRPARQECHQTSGNRSGV